MDQLLQAKLILESEQKYLSQLITLGSSKNKAMRENLLIENKKELYDINTLLMTKCNHEWIKDEIFNSLDDTVTKICYCNICGLPYKNFSPIN